MLPGKSLQETQSIVRTTFIVLCTEPLAAVMVRV